jgi:tRNA A-37 threonylcarbamoyl transferase component Bud32
VQTSPALGENPAALNLRQRVMAVLKLGALLAKLHAVDIAFGDLNKGAVKVRPMVMPTPTSNSSIWTRR